MGTVRHLQAAPVSERQVLRTLDETAGVLRCSRRTVLRLTASGALRSVKIGRRRLVAAEDLDAYVQTLRARP